MLFAATAGASVFAKKASAKETCSLKNSAFVFVKPHANTAATQDMVREKLLEKGVEILSESDIDGATIDEKKLIEAVKLSMENPFASNKSPIVWTIARNVFTNPSAATKAKVAP